MKIAGLSTLGLTAVGVAMNVAEAKVLSDIKADIKAETAKHDKILQNKQEFKEVCLDPEVQGMISSDGRLCTVTLDWPYACSELEDIILLNKQAKTDAGGKCKDYRYKNSWEVHCEADGYAVKDVFKCSEN